MMFKLDQVNYYATRFTLLFILVLVLGGCSNFRSTSASPPEAVAVAATPVVTVLTNPNGTEVAAGSQVAISLEATGPNLQFQWQVAKGSLSRTQGPSVIYTAPNIPGIDTVDVVIASDTGQTTKTVTFTVLEPPTDIEPRTEPTEEPAPEPTESPTEEPTQVPMEEPTQESASESPEKSVEEPQEPAQEPTEELKEELTGELPPDTITLTSLHNDQLVPCENLAEGKISPNITDPIWPVIFIGNLYHPQDEGGKAPPKFEDEWFGTVRFGNCQKPEQDVGKIFQLIIFAAGEQCNKEFEEYLAKGQTTGQWPGMPELAEDCKEYVRIRVTRQ